MNACEELIVFPFFIQFKILHVLILQVLFHEPVMKKKKNNFFAYIFFFTTCHSVKCCAEFQWARCQQIKDITKKDGIPLHLVMDHILL